MPILGPAFAVTPVLQLVHSFCKQKDYPLAEAEHFISFILDRVEVGEV